MHRSTVPSWQDLAIPAGPPAPPEDLLAAGRLGGPGVGVLDVAIGPRLRDRLAARLAGHRRQGRVPVELLMEDLTAPQQATSQRWTRLIDGRATTSTVTWTDRPPEGAAVERFGPITLTFQARTETEAETEAEIKDNGESDAEPDGTTPAVELRLAGAAIALGGATLRVPARLTPDVRSRTRLTLGGGFAVDVRVRSRRRRTMVAYRGELA